DAIDWSNPEVAERIQALIDQGLVKVRVRGAPHKHHATRTTTNAPTAITCTECGTTYRGGFAKSNLARHVAKAHAVREEVPA
ncbi:MAG: hypothetical protein AAB922_01150, partial [Patescibacteria group bacterium]